MAIDWDALRNTCTGIIEGLGKQVTFRHVTSQGAFDANTGQYSDDSYEEYTVTVVNVSSVAGYIKGIAINYNENTVIMAANDIYTPAAGDIMVDGEVQRDVLSVKTTDPAGVALIHQVELKP